MSAHHSLRSAPWCLAAIVFATACATGDTESDTSQAAIVACDVAYEDASIVVYRAGDVFTYAAKELRVRDVLITPPSPSQGTRWVGPLRVGRTDYALTPTVDPAHVAEVSARLGVAIASAKLTVDATSGDAVLAAPFVSPESAQAGGWTNANIAVATKKFVARAAEPSELTLRVENGLFFLNAPRKQSLFSVTASAKATCAQGKTATVALSTARPVNFIPERVRSYSPNVEMVVIEEYFGYANSLREERPGLPGEPGLLYRELAALGPEAFEKGRLLVASIDTEIVTAFSLFPDSLTREELKVRVRRVYAAERAFMEAVGRSPIAPDPAFARVAAANREHVEQLEAVTHDGITTPYAVRP